MSARTTTVTSGLHGALLALARDVLTETAALFEPGSGFVWSTARLSLSSDGTSVDLTTLEATKL